VSRKPGAVQTLFGAYPFLLRLYADSGYQGPKFQQGLKRVYREVNLEIVRRSDACKFVVLPKRWIVERTIGWLNRCRRLGKDWECLNRNAVAFLRWASIRLMVRSPRDCQEFRVRGGMMGWKEPLYAGTVRNFVCAGA
jgi:transposase